MKKITPLALIFVIITSITVSAQKGHIIEVANFQFSPNSLIINLGDTIIWKWISGTHTSTSETIPENLDDWHFNLNSDSQTATYVPLVLGEYNYKCLPHESFMKASFTVVETDTTVTGIKKHDLKNEVTISYNSFQNTLSIMFNDMSVSNYSLIVFNISGQIMYSQGLNIFINSTTDVKLPVDLNSGIYLVNIKSTSDNSYYTKKIFIQ